MSCSSFKERTVKIILSEKEKDFGVCKYYSPLGDGIFITPVTFNANSDQLIENLAYWRADNQHAFPKIFNVTIQGTRNWLELAVQQRQDRLLFLVYDCYNQMIGHMGVSSFDFNNELCEIDNVVRGKVSKQKGVMFSASKILLGWIEKMIMPRDIRLRVLNDNSKALALYHKIGFVPKALEALEKSETDVVEWLPATNGAVDRFFIIMNLEGK